MFSNVFDSVKNEPCNIANAEGYAHLLLLRGKLPVLSPNQAIDSSVIVNNLMNESTQESFLKLFKEEKIKISVAGNINSISDYLNNALTRCVKGGENSFIFSSLSFLYQYIDEPDKLKEIYICMQKAFNENVSFIQKSTILTPDERNLIESYLIGIKKLDLAVQGKLSLGKKFIPRKKQLQKIFANRVYLLNKVGKKIGIDENCIELANKLVNTVKTGHRSSYYMYLGIPPKKELDLNISELFCKRLVDICYNEALAYSQNDNYHTTIIPNITNDEKMLSKLYNQCKDISIINDSLLICADSKNSDILNPVNQKAPEILTWERTANIVDEIKAIQSDKKGLSWNEAVDKYNSRQIIKPFLMSGHLIGISTINFFVSSFIGGQLPALKKVISPIIGTPLFNKGVSVVGSYINNFILDNTSDVVRDILNVPSIKDIITQSNESKSNIESLNFAFKQTEFIHK